MECPDAWEGGGAISANPAHRGVNREWWPEMAPLSASRCGGKSKIFRVPDRVAVVPGLSGGLGHLEKCKFHRNIRTGRSLFGFRTLPPARATGAGRRAARATIQQGLNESWRVQGHGSGC